MEEPPREEPDWSEFPPYLGSPPPSPFHGFGAEDNIPGRLEIHSEVVNGEEVLLSVQREKKTGRPSGKFKADQTLVLAEKRRKVSQSADPLPSKPKEPSVTPKVMLGGTGSRPSLYLVGNPPEKLRNAKLPTTGAVLGRFLDILKNSNVYVYSNVSEATTLTRLELKAVWQHHFGSRLVEGKELGIEEAGEEKRKIVKQDRFIDEMIRGVWKEWSRLEGESRRPSRSSTDAFKRKEEKFVEGLRKPFNISKISAEAIMKDSGILDWREEAQHLRNQLSDEQVGCPGPLDTSQKKTDTRKIVNILSAEKTLQKKLEKETELLQRKQAEKTATGEETVAEDNKNNYEDFTVKVKKRKKMDIMGEISITADRAKVSYAARSMVAASTANALGIDLADTNISKTSAWRKAKEVRTETAEKIKEVFKCPVKVSVHWDGKGMILKGNIKSNRVCVYVSGADEDCTRKLLAVPETPNGTGLAEANIVTELLASWNISKEVIAMVFYSTSSNTGADSGACKFVEEWCETPILWLACRHHIAELHISKVVQVVTGNTKDPGVALFRRLKKEWSKLDIDLDNLVLFDVSSLDQQLQSVAQSVLTWAEERLVKQTWPREDYLELLELLIITLGGTVNGFCFKMPGADHHARWMSKVIYYLKIRLLSNIFELTPEQQEEVDQVAEFSVLFYIKYWLQTPLPSCAAS